MHGHEVLGCVRKQAEPAGSFPLRFLPLILLKLLPALTSISDGVQVGHGSQINAFLAKHFGTVFLSE